jgi:hypothetical protein
MQLIVPCSDCSTTISEYTMRASIVIWSKWKAPRGFGVALLTILAASSLHLVLGVTSPFARQVAGWHVLKDPKLLLCLSYVML